MKSDQKWYKSLGLGVIPVLVDDAFVSAVAREGELELETGRASIAACPPSELISQKLVFLAYLLLACRFTEQALAEIKQSTVAEFVYSLSKGKHN